MTTARPRVIREEYRLARPTGFDGPQSSFMELRHRHEDDNPAGRIIISVASQFDVQRFAFATDRVDEARAFWREQRALLTHLGYERVRFNVKDGYKRPEEMFTQGQNVYVEMRNGRVIEGVIVRTPGQDYDNGTKQLGPDEYRIRSGSLATGMAHLTVDVCRLRARD